MKVFFAADHAGLQMKSSLLASLEGQYELVDVGPYELRPDDDYPLYAVKLAQNVVANPGSMGVVVCASGQGMAIAANKIKGVRASVVWNETIAQETRVDNDSNVLSLPSRSLSPDQALAIVAKWLTTPFSNEERHIRRILEISKIERENG